MKHLLSCLLLVLFCSALHAEPARETLLTRETHAWPGLPSPRPGFAAGLADGHLLVLGGQGHETEVQALDLRSWLDAAATPEGGWKAVQGTARPSFSGVAQHSTGLVCVGGLDAQGPSRRVTLVSWSAGSLRETELPPLPLPLAGCGAAIVKDQLYVLGGISATGADKAERALLRLNLKDTTAGWTALEPFPGNPKVLPVVFAQYDVVHVIGGREGVAGQGGLPLWKASNETWVYRPVPLDGTTQRGWIRRSPLPVAMAAGGGAGLGQAHCLIACGDTTAETRQPLAVTADSTAGMSYLYHTLTDSWVETGVPLQGTGTLGIKHPSPTRREILLVDGLGTAGLSQLKARRTVRNLAWQDYLVMGGYFVVLAGIGFFASRRQSTSSDYSLGNRSTQWWAAGISMFATGASAISFMAIPALAFSTNLFQLFPTCMLILGFFVQAYLVFPLLRKLEITSTYEYLERRFDRSLCLIASAQSILFQTFGRAAVVLALPSIAISATTGMNVFVCVLFMGALTTAYTAVGGIKAVIWTDVFQGVLKFLAPIAMIVVCLFSLPGGPREFLSIGSDYAKFDFALMTWDMTVPAIWVMLIGTFLQCTVQLAGDQPTIQRVFCSPPHEVRRISFVYVVCGILISTVVNILGIAIFAYFHTHADKMDPGAPNDQIVPMFAVQGLSPGFSGIIIAAIFASAMSTVASSMNSSATIFTQDFFMRRFPATGDKTKLRVLRLTSLIVGVTGTGMALVLVSKDIRSMMVVWNQIVALLGGGIVGLYSLGMLTKRATVVGAIGGVCCSIMITSYVWAFTRLHWASYTPIAILSCIACGYVLSLVLPGRQRDLRGLTIFTLNSSQGDSQGGRSH